MEEKDIKPIPKYILAKIKKEDKKHNPKQVGKTRFYAYLTICKKELVKITVAVKYRYKKFYCKQVAVHGLNSQNCLVKDLEYCGYSGMGYRVGWFAEGLQKYAKWFETKSWCIAKDKYYDPYAIIVNMELLGKIDEFKYSAYELYTGTNILKYLKLYKQYPHIEYLMKSGFNKIAESIIILKLCGKDKGFCKWLIRNKQQLISRHYYTKIIVKAYKQNASLNKLQRIEQAKQSLKYDDCLKPIKNFFKGNDLEKFFDYISRQETNARSYLDYFEACNFLELDMTLNKNRFPKDFKRWHDIRIDEFNTRKAMQDLELQKQLNLQFEQVAKKYLSLQHNKRSNFIAIIAKSRDNLIFEGEQLHHCVGRMNYDQRFIREDSLIFFIRNKQTPDIPFVTVEYSLKTRKVLQCYGDHDSKPNDDILHYVNKIWLPYANKMIKKIPA